MTRLWQTLIVTKRVAQTKNLTRIRMTDQEKWPEKAQISSSFSYLEDAEWEQKYQGFAASHGV